MVYKLIIIAYLTAFSVCYAVDPASAAAAAAVTTKVSPLLLAGASALGAGVTSAFNWFNARKSEQFSERMANTSHQREVEDLRLAGLNPILSAGGKGAPAPTGNMAQGSDLGDALTKGLSSAAALAQIDNMGAQARKTSAEASLLEQQYQDSNANREIQIARLAALHADYRVRMQQPGISKQQYTQMFEKTKEIMQNILNLKAEQSLTGLEVEHSRLGLNQAKAESKMWGGPGGYILPYLNSASKLKDLIPGRGPRKITKPLPDMPDMFKNPRHQPTVPGWQK